MSGVTEVTDIPLEPAPIAGSPRLRARAETEAVRAKRKRRKASQRISGVPKAVAKPSHKTMHSLALLAQHNPSALKSAMTQSTDMRGRQELLELQAKLERSQKDFETAMDLGEQLSKENKRLKDAIVELEDALSYAQERNEYWQEAMQQQSEENEAQAESFYAEIESMTDTIQQLESQLAMANQSLVEQVRTTEATMKRAQTLMDLDSDKSDPITAVPRELTRTRTEDKSLIRRLKEEERRNDELNKQLDGVMDELTKLDETKEELRKWKKKCEELDGLMESDATERKLLVSQLIESTALSAHKDHQLDELFSRAQQLEHEISLLTAVNTKQTEQITHIRNMSVMSMTSTTADTETDASLSIMITSTLDDGVDAEAELASLPMGTMTPLGENSETDFPYEDVLDGVEIEDADDGSDAVGSSPVPSEGPKMLAKKSSERKKLEIDARDVMKEFLYLTATAVRFKFPGLNDKITAAELIEKSRHRPFYQFNDYMISILESMKLKMEEEKRSESAGLLGAREATGSSSHHHRRRGSRSRRKSGRGRRRKSRSKAGKADSGADGGTKRRRRSNLGRLDDDSPPVSDYESDDGITSADEGDEPVPTSQVEVPRKASRSRGGVTTDPPTRMKRQKSGRRRRKKHDSDSHRTRTTATSTSSGNSTKSPPSGLRESSTSSAHDPDVPVLTPEGSGDDELDIEGILENIEM